MKTTYRAMQVSRPGVLELVERPTPTPGPGQVLIAVEACCVCGADAADVERADPAQQPPRVPGHEVVGRIVALGAGVPALWKLGQRVGVGRLGGHCNECAPCRQGRFQLCQNQPVVGSSCDGGYAEMMLARGTALVSIPDALASEEAAPILCAGIATFNALKKCGAQAGDTVAVLGIGGLGHMALQYARRMGFRVVAIGRGSDIAADALALGAHVYIDNRAEDAIARLKALGGAQAIVTMIDDAGAVSALLPGLAPEGRLVVLNPGKAPLSVPAGLLVGGQRSILGSITGTPCDNEKTLNFSVLADVRPRIEVLPLAQANEALRRLKSGDVRYRTVLTIAPRPIPRALTIEPEPPRRHEMKRYLPCVGLVAAVVAAAPPVLAEEFAPYGSAKADLRETLAADVVFDVNYAEPQQLHGLYGYVKNMQKAAKGRLVVLTRGPELRAFAKENYLQYQDIVDRMAGLAKEGVEFRLCSNAMKAAGFRAEDMHGFLTVAEAGGFPELVYWMSQGYKVISQSVNPTPLPVRGARYLDQPGLKQ